MSFAIAILVMDCDHPFRISSRTPTLVTNQWVFDTGNFGFDVETRLMIVVGTFTQYWNWMTLKKVGHGTMAPFCSQQVVTGFFVTMFIPQHIPKKYTVD
jgi:hypothetical protein